MASEDFSYHYQPRVSVNKRVLRGVKKYRGEGPTLYLGKSQNAQSSGKTIEKESESHSHPAVRMRQKLKKICTSGRLGKGKGRRT